jgi:hypothetical protein
MIPTSKEFLERDESGVYNEVDITHAMIEFTKLHVKAALEAASEQADIKDDWDNRKGSIDRDSILNAYSLENIK